MAASSTAPAKDTPRQPASFAENPLPRPDWRVAGSEIGTPGCPASGLRSRRQASLADLASASRREPDGKADRLLPASAACSSAPAGEGAPGSPRPRELGGVRPPATHRAIQPLTARWHERSCERACFRKLASATVGGCSHSRCSGSSASVSPSSSGPVSASQKSAASSRNGRPPMRD